MDDDVDSAELAYRLQWLGEVLYDDRQRPALLEFAAADVVNRLTVETELLHKRCGRSVGEVLSGTGRRLVYLDIAEAPPDGADAHEWGVPGALTHPRPGVDLRRQSAAVFPEHSTAVVLPRVLTAYCSRCRSAVSVPLADLRTHQGRRVRLR